MDELLHLLRRVEFVKFSEQGKEAYWYLNLLKKTTDQLDVMGFKNIFEAQLCHFTQIPQIVEE